MEPIIEVRNIGKRYDIAHMRGGYVALRDVLATMIKNPGGFLAHKAKRAVGLEKKEEFWALRNVNFTVKRGEVIGVIGSNGAGKSTLLKILSQITPPTEGEIIIRGRVGSLLEVGTGFHPELTGRENIFLNGAILGMKKDEIAAKFDKIVAFAGVEKFLDTPVKHYSSGMYVRLAFSVAAHMEPDILMVDEVLAVGDAEFQKKCLGKMDEITKKDGRTILFVSHNMSAIQNLCPTTIHMQHGRVRRIGPTDEVIKEYLTEAGARSALELSKRIDRAGNGMLRFTDAYILNKEGQRASQIDSGSSVKLIFEYECKPGAVIGNVILGANLVSPGGEGISLLHTEMTKTELKDIAGKGRFECDIKKLPLVSGPYSLHIRALADGMVADDVKNVLSFDVLPGDFFGTGSAIKHSQIYIDHKWKHKSL
jgi:lipopolysaccharide transport system ATP-binding protein